MGSCLGTPFLTVYTWLCVRSCFYEAVVEFCVADGCWLDDGGNAGSCEHMGPGKRPKWIGWRTEKPENLWTNFQRAKGPRPPQNLAAVSDESQELDSEISKGIIVCCHAYLCKPQLTWKTQVKDSNRQSGRGRATCPFYDKLDNILNTRALSSPVVLLENAQNTSDSPSKH